MCKETGLTGLLELKGPDLMLWTPNYEVENHWRLKHSNKYTEQLPYANNQVLHVMRNAKFGKV